MTACTRGFTKTTSLLLQRGNGRRIRNEIVDAAHSIGNVTAYYTLKMTTADTYELTVHVSEDKKMLGSERCSETYTYTGNHNLANDIKQYWDLNSATWDRMAAAMGFNAEAGQRPSDGELSGSFWNASSTCSCTWRTTWSQEKTGTSTRSWRGLLPAETRRRCGRLQELYDATVNARMAPNSRQLSAARWFHNRKLSELEACGNLRYVPHSVYGAWNRFPFNGDPVADCSQVPEHGRGYQGDVCGMPPPDELRNGRRGAGPLRQEYRREFGDARRLAAFKTS